MSKELNAKWLELVAAGRAEWMPGMRAIDSDGQAARVVRATGAAVLEDVGGAAYPNLRSSGTESRPKESRSGFRSPTCPDWSDPGTLGALLGQVEVRWSDPLAHVAPTFDGLACTGWRVWLSRDLSVWFQAELKAGALLAALEAAP